MDWQKIAVLCIVGATALAFVWRQWRRRVHRSGPVSPCDCPPGDVPPETVFHVRKGERPTLTIKSK